MATNNSHEPTNCNRFGYARLDDDVIIKVKPASILKSYVNGFWCNKYTIIESYDFFTKRQKDVPSDVTKNMFCCYNETDTYFSRGFNKFGQLTGKYESTDINGLKTVMYLSNGKLNRDNDLPADIGYYENGNKRYEIWYVNGQCPRDGDLPTYVAYYEDGNKLFETWFVNGQFHRDGDRPAKICYYENGNKRSEEWYVNGQLHRDGDEPTDILYYQNGKKQYENILC